MIRPTSFIAALLVPFVVASAVQASVTISYRLTNACADDTNLPYPVVVSDNSTSFPYATTMAAVHGDSSGTTDINFSENLSQMVFHWDFNHAYAEKYLSLGSFWDQLNFTTGADEVGYDLSGTYRFTTNDGKQIYLWAWIRDQTNDQDIFRSRQISYNTPDESLTLGLTGADHTNELFGNPTGTLAANGQYVLQFSAFIMNRYRIPDPTISGSASSEGELLFKLTSESSVPEPTTFIIWSLLGGLSLAVGWHRRRKTA